MKRLFTILPILTAILLTTACQPSSPPQGKLAEVLARGTLVIATNPDYPPQSELIPGTVRAGNTRCGPFQYTANQVRGFDVEVGKEIARRLGVEPCFLLPRWDEIAAGGWNDRWDVSIASMTITPPRLEIFYFSQPYYVTPATFFVHKDSTLQDLSQLSGKRIGVCVDTTYEQYLRTGTVDLFSEVVPLTLENVSIKPYETDLYALQELALGDGVRLNAVLTAQPVGFQAIADGMLLRQLGEPVFSEYLAVAVDKSAAEDPLPLIQRVSEIIQRMHKDGTLLRLSRQFYNLDLVTPAAEFDLSVLNQW